MEKFDYGAIFLEYGEKYLNTGAVMEEWLWKRDERFIGHG
jgi:hypothetical protein